MGDADSRCTASSLQQFAGEDLGIAARRDAQKRENLTAWEQHSLEKCENRAAVKTEKLEHANLVRVSFHPCL